MRSFGNIATVLAIAALTVTAFVQQVHINQLEERVSIVEHEQARIVNGMKQTVDLLAEVAARAAREE